jgi:transcriptional regulator with XRE-family HTH domain
MNRLKDLRVTNKMTVRELAEKSGVVFSTISALETGKRRMTLNHAKALSKVFGVSVDYMMGTDAIYYAGSFEDALNNLLLDMVDDITAASVQNNLSTRTRLIYVIIERLVESDLSDSDLEAVLLYVDGLIDKKGDK